MVTQSIHFRETHKVIKTHPIWSSLPCNPGKFFSPFFLHGPSGGERFSVFEMVYVNVAFIETSWDVIIVLLGTYEQ